MHTKHASCHNKALLHFLRLIVPEWPGTEGCTEQDVRTVGNTQSLYSHDCEVSKTLLPPSHKGEGLITFLITIYSDFKILDFTVSTYIYSYFQKTKKNTFRLEQILHEH